MDLASVIAACSLVQDVRLVVAMAVAFGGGHPYAMLSTSQHENHLAHASELSDSDSDADAISVAKPKTSAQAEAELQKRLADGDTVVVGLVPVSASWATEFGRQPEELLSACANVSIATAKLAEFAGACKRRGRSCVLRRYAREAGLAGFEEDVLEILRSRADERRAGGEGDIAPADSPAGEGSWGANQLFFAIPDQKASLGTSARDPTSTRRDDSRKADHAGRGK